MIAEGIIDPAKVTRSALQNAASIAALFLTTRPSWPTSRRRLRDGWRPHRWHGWHGLLIHPLVEEAARGRLETSRGTPVSTGALLHCRARGQT